MNEPNRSSAVVIGGSMAGLLAARVLSERFGRVTVVERDELEDTPTWRKGVPQGRHVHALMPAGARMLEQWFPGLRDDLVADGAHLGDWGEVSWHQAGGYRKEIRSGIELIMASRPLIEHHVRRRVLALPNVSLRAGTSADGLVLDGSTVTGVRVEGGQQLAATLVVDASGRGARSVKWLSELGYDVPETSSIRIDMGYATRLVRPDPRAPRVPACSIPDAPSLRGGIAFPIEGGEWLVTLGWWHGDRAPSDDAGYLDFARGLSNPRIAQVLETAETVGDVMTHGMPASQRRHVERLRRVPGGLVLLGDAICSFNPIYGQGMTSAAFQAECLADALDRVDGTGSRFVRTYYKRASKAVDTPWQISAGGDFAFPQTTGPKAPGTDLMNVYLKKVFRASHTSPVVARRVLEVTALLAPPTVLLRPGMVAAVLSAGRRPAAYAPPALAAQR